MLVNIVLNVKQTRVARKKSARHRLHTGRHVKSRLALFSMLLMLSTFFQSFESFNFEHEFWNAPEKWTQNSMLLFARQWFQERELDIWIHQKIKSVRLLKRTFNFSSHFQLFPSINDYQLHLNWQFYRIHHIRDIMITF